MSDDTFAEAVAHLQVVRGSIEPEELAALVASVAVMAAAPEDDVSAPTSAWMDRGRTLRGQRGTSPLGRGDSAWRHSLR